MLSREETRLLEIDLNLTISRGAATRSITISRRNMVIVVVIVVSDGSSFSQEQRGQEKHSSVYLNKKETVCLVKKRGVNKLSTEI